MQRLYALFCIILLFFSVNVKTAVDCRVNIMTAQCIRSSRLRADYARCVNGLYLGWGVKILGQRQTAFCPVSAYQVLQKPRNFKCTFILKKYSKVLGGLLEEFRTCRQTSSQPKSDGSYGERRRDSVAMGYIRSASLPTSSSSITNSSVL